MFLTAPPRALDPTGALAAELAAATNASAFVVDPTDHEPPPLSLPVIERFGYSGAETDAAPARGSAGSARDALEAAAGNAWARSDARARRVALANDDILVRATAPETSEPSVDWALGRARRLLTRRRNGCVDVLCAASRRAGIRTVAFDGRGVAASGAASLRAVGVRWPRRRRKQSAFPLAATSSRTVGVRFPGRRRKQSAFPLAAASSRGSASAAAWCRRERPNPSPRTRQVADEESFEDLEEIFVAGVKGEAARRSDPTEPLARVVRVAAAAVPEAVARREAADDVFFRRATRTDRRAIYDRLLDEHAVYWVSENDSATLSAGAAFVAEDYSRRDDVGCVGVVVDWERWEDG